MLGPIGTGHHHRIYTAGDIQKLLTLEERISEVITVLESNVEVMDSLKRFYEKLVVNKDFDLKEDCSYDIDVFASQLSQMMDDFRLQIGRAKALVRVMSNRTELVKQHRLERLNGNLEKEAIVVRIVTIVTLIYLPATFVSVRAMNPALQGREVIFWPTLILNVADAVQHRHHQVPGLATGDLFCGGYAAMAAGYSSTDFPDSLCRVPGKKLG